MGDLFGHRRVFLSGLFWFGLWSMVNGFSKTPVMLCISRALQGMGAAAQIPTALALIAIKYPAGKSRTRALSVFGAIGAMGAVTGLLLSGALTSTIGWQWIFFISAIMSAILFVVGIFAIPDTRGFHGESPRIDVGGAITATSGIVCVIYYISSGVETGWASVKTLPVLCIGIVLLAAFIMIEKRISYPIMPFHVWKHRAFSTSFVLIFIMQASFQGFLYYSTLIFQEVMGYSIMRTSLSYLAHGLSGIFLYTILGKFLPRLPLKPFIALGFLLLGCSSLMFAFVKPTSIYWELPFFAMIVNVFGLGLIMLPAQITALKDAADDDQGVVGAIYNVGLQIGSPFGLAILTVISGKLNGVDPGPERMYGYKYSLIGSASLAFLGLALTLIFLPDVKAAVTKNPSLEEGGIAANDQDSMAEKDTVTDQQEYPQKQDLEESKEDVLQNPSIIEEETMVVAKVQFA
ncbi:major facilitator superfamily domain-containing protein [Dissophora ornata]|nr:major facilitator superfamily domain-containing protein [Dissophora ornata]